MRSRLPQRLAGLSVVVAGAVLITAGCGPRTPPVDPSIATAIAELRASGQPFVAAETLLDLGADSIGPLLSLAADEHASYESRWHALHLVACIGEVDAQSAERLAGLLADTNEGIAGKCADVVGRVRPFPQRAVEARLASSEPHHAHRYAAWILGRHADDRPEALAPLLDALSRAVAARPAAAAEECEIALRHAIAAAAPDSAETVAALEPGVVAPEARVREFALMDLAQCGESGLRVLARVTHEGVDTSLRYQAVRRLGRAGDAAGFAAPEIVRRTEEAPGVSFHAALLEALGAIGVWNDDTIGAIRAGFTSEAVPVRVAAASAVASAPEAVLRAELWRATQDAEVDVAVAAAASLMQCDDVEAAELEPLLESPSSRVRWYARRAWAARVSREQLFDELASGQLDVGAEVLILALARFPEQAPDSWERVAGVALGADEPTREALVEFAAHVGEPAVPVLAEIAAPGVSAQSAGAAFGAAEVLRDIGTPAAWDALATVDVDSVPRHGIERLRALVFAALARVAGDDASRRARVTAALSDPSDRVRFSAAVGIVRADREWAAELLHEGQLDLHTLLYFDLQESEGDRRAALGFVREMGVGVPGIRGRLLLMAQREDVPEPEREACEAAAAALAHDPR